VLCSPLWLLLVGAQVFALLVSASSAVPTVDPYLPRRKRPPSYLEPFLARVNALIDRTADRLAPMIRCAPATHRSSAARKSSGPRQCHDTSHITSLCFRIRHLPRRVLPSRSMVLALSAITVGIARAHSAAAERRSRRAIFDSDSFDILVDGGATSCISNTLTDFVKPPRPAPRRSALSSGPFSMTLATAAS
jgi:hypothetical protein